MTTHPYRYYVTFTHQIPAGLGVGALVLARTAPITSPDDIAVLTNDLAGKGYRSVTVLGFSLFADQPEVTQ